MIKMNKNNIKSILFFLMILLIMFGLTTVSAIENNVTDDTNMQDIVTDDTVQTTDYSNKIVKQDTIADTTKSSDKLNNNVTKKNATLYWGYYGVEPDHAYINKTSSYGVYSYDEIESVIFKFNNVESPTMYDILDNHYFYTEYTPDSLGPLNITVIYPGNDEFNPVSISTILNVTKPIGNYFLNWISTSVELGDTIELNGYYYIDDDEYYFVNKEVTLNFDGTNYTTTVRDDTSFSFVITPTKIGEYPTLITFEGDETYDKCSVEGSLIVTEKENSDDNHVNIKENDKKTNIHDDNSVISIKKLLSRFDNFNHRVSVNKLIQSSDNEDKVNAGLDNNITNETSINNKEDVNESVAVGNNYSSPLTDTSTLIIIVLIVAAVVVVLLFISKKS